jgi:hypothetical protein
MSLVLLFNHRSPSLLPTLRLLGRKYISLVRWDGIGREPVVKTCYTAWGMTTHDAGPCTITAVPLINP